jgi:glycosyltransferase involved in cell wall biosynthesis
MSQLVIALLGRKDEPTDAVEEYCRYLGNALRPHDVQLEIRRVPWEIRGWAEALRTLKVQATDWRGTWVLLQYTALAWSARGFPHKFLRVLKILKSAGARAAIVFHDVQPYSGARVIDKLRRTTQFRTMRLALSLADLAVFTVPPEKLRWLSVVPPHTVFVPVGPNLPIPSEISPRETIRGVPTIGVFSITGGQTGAEETRVIVAAVRHTAEKLGQLRLSVFGRHAELRKADLHTGLRDVPVELRVEGVLTEQEVVERLQSCDVLLFVRGGISSRRGSAIAGIACGVPMVAYAGPETSWPVTDAGVLLVSPQHPQKLEAGLIRILSEEELRAGMSLASRMAYRQHFSWSAIAARFATLLRN